jgi:hypothetical protein
MEDSLGIKTIPPIEHKSKNKLPDQRLQINTLKEQKQCKRTILDSIRTLPLKPNLTSPCFKFPSQK